MGSWLGGETHVGDDGDEGVRDGEGEALRGARLEALLHQGEAVLPAEQTDVAQQMQRHLHVLVNTGGEDKDSAHRAHRAFSHAGFFVFFYSFHFPEVEEAEVGDDPPPPNPGRKTLTSLSRDS